MSLEIEQLHYYYYFNCISENIISLFFLVCVSLLFYVLKAFCSIQFTCCFCLLALNSTRLNLENSTNLKWTMVNSSKSGYLAIHTHTHKHKHIERLLNLTTKGRLTRICLMFIMKYSCCKNTKKKETSFNRISTLVERKADIDIWSKG